MKRQFFFLICSIFAYYSFGQTRPIPLESRFSDTEKIFGLSKCWSEVKYNFVYFDRLTFDWDSLYQATIPVVLATKNDLEYYRELQRFVAKLKDGHTSVFMPSDRDDIRDSRFPMPFFTRLIDGKMVVTEVINDALEDERVKRGLEIIKINGIDIHEYVSTNIKPFISASTEQSLNSSAYGEAFRRGKLRDTVRLTFKDDSHRVFESAVRYRGHGNLPSIPLFDFNVLENNIGMLKIDNFWQGDFKEQFDAIYEKILATDALIIDIRGNGGGNTNNSEYILSNLTDVIYEMSILSSPRYIPAFASWGSYMEWYIREPWIGQPIKDKPIYSKPATVLIDERTFSAAENFCIGFRNMKRGLIIGTPSGGSTGNPIFFQLPGGGGIRICTLKDTYPDGTEFVGVGILPDIEVRETVSSFLSKLETGVDNSNAKRKAIEILKKK
jgi:C-terminal processing protease CtpA/Prc